MSVETKKDIIDQRNQVFEKTFKVDLKDSCNIGTGILRLNDLMLKEVRSTFINAEFSSSFFIPASGSGSRMFKFLFQWLENEVETKEISHFFQELDEFPFKSELTSDGTDNRELVKEILNKYSTLPKGLIPFHKYPNEIRTAFQEHVSQAKLFFGDDVKIHFTIQQKSEGLILENLGLNNNISFSYQNDETDAFCFDNGKEIVKEGNQFLRRPAGHGALLENLNALDEDVILLKNIDNIQHGSKSKPTKDTWSSAVGTLLLFQNELKEIAKNYSIEKLIELNNKFQFLSQEALQNFTHKDFQNIISRPTRVCGMVKNEGEPGGGPFWVSDENGISNQIVEKAQIKNDDSQLKIVQSSSHFNPVFIALSKTDCKGNPLDLLKYRDDSKFFVVKKTHKGKDILYRELPGLWNGSMSNWNTIFLEIPQEVFTPVKSVLDLL